MMFPLFGIVHMLLVYVQITIIICHIKDLGETQTNFDGIEMLIGGGKPAALKMFSFNVQFFNRGGFCSGSIITKKTVLTAAHCFEYNKNIGEMRVFSASQYVLDRHRQQHKVWEFRIHPQYNTRATFSDDIAIILINDDFVFGPEVQPVMLSDTEEWKKDKETSFIATGWGANSSDGIQSSGLMETNLQYFPQKECMKLYESKNFSPEMFCLYGNGTRDTCKGDSGGGILWNRVIVGIVSHGKGCLTYPGIYVNVYYYTAWIMNTTSELYNKYCHFHNFG